MEGLSGWVSLVGSARLGSPSWVCLDGVSRAGWDWPARVGRFGLTIHLRLPTSEGHNFFVRTSIQVFLDSMEIPLSQDFSHVPVEDIGQLGRLGLAG